LEVEPASDVRLDRPARGAAHVGTSLAEYLAEAAGGIARLEHAHRRPGLVDQRDMRAGERRGHRDIERRDAAVGRRLAELGALRAAGEGDVDPNARFA